VGRFRERVRELTLRTRGVSTERMAEELSRCLRGWIGYFGKCETPSVLEDLERWFRRRLRSASLETVEARIGAVTAGSGQRSHRANGGERSSSVEAGAQLRAAECLLRLARAEINWRPIAEPTEPPYTDPYVRWCNRESGRPPTYVNFCPIHVQLQGQSPVPDLTKYASCAVLLMLDHDTRRVYRMLDFTKHLNLRPGSAYCAAGKVNSVNALYLVIEFGQAGHQAPAPFHNSCSS
jgi:Group II intron, maturase-specific domain